MKGTISTAKVKAITKLEEYVSVTLRRDKLDKLLTPGNEEDE